MGIKSFLGLDCNEAANACHKAEYNEAGWADKLRLKLHFFLCAPCKAYSEDNQKLSHLLKKAKIHSCTYEEKEAFRQRMKEQNSNNSE